MTSQVMDARSGRTRVEPMTTLTADETSVGGLLRTWRQRRRLSQLELSSRAEVSTRHLSCLETGRARPTPDMILRLAEHLEVPLRERNRLLLAGGYAPRYTESALDDGALAPVLSGLRDLLDAHLPRPALLLDERWTLLDANAMVEVLAEGATPRCWSPRSTSYASACTRTGWRRGSATWPPGDASCTGRWCSAPSGPTTRGSTSWRRRWRRTSDRVRSSHHRRVRC